VGDCKYGRAKESYPDLALHAWSISFTHPFSGQRLMFAAKVPACFRKLVGDFALEQI
jgi:tRNA pseudouridine32 synthase/23S rRNA pseudouridine746 synthase/23S rRNA pseudouridine1911/1915/1917 synthase